MMNGYTRYVKTEPIKEFARYLPTAFDDSLSLLEKINKVIAHINQFGLNMNDIIDEWESFKKWITEEGLEDALREQLEKWKEDGTLENIINEEIFTNLSNDLKDLIDKINRLENDFNYDEIEPTFYTNLGLRRNAVNQCFKIDVETNQLIGSQSDVKTPEGFVLSKMSPSGRNISSMEILEGGHGTLFGLDRKSNGELKVWVYHEGLSKLIHFGYRDDAIMTLDDAKPLTDFTPKSLVGQLIYVTYDHQNDNLIFFIHATKKVQIRKRTDVLAFKDTFIYEVDVDPGEWNTERPFQGGVADGTNLYVMSGTGSISSDPIISLYDAKTNSKVKRVPLNDLNYEDGVGFMRDNFAEPEGLEFYVNPYNNKKTLLFCLSNGGALKRYHNVYTINQHGNENHFNSMVQINSQNYAITHSDGRAFQIKDSETDLNKMFEVGYYYIKDDKFAELKNLPPYPNGTTGDGSWWFEVKPGDQYFTVRQVLTRLSYTQKNIQFERTISKYNENVGQWNIITSKSLVDPNYATPSMYANKLSNVVIPDNYYITTPMSLEYDDMPEKGVSGWWLVVSGVSSDGRVEQRLTLNNDTYYREYRRLVNIKTGVAVSNWFKLDYDTVFPQV